VSPLLPRPLLLITMSNIPPRTPRSKWRNHANFDKTGATPTRAGDNFVSSTKLGHTQQEIKSSLWGRVLKNGPEFIERLVKPHLVDNTLVDAIEHAMSGNAELKAARNLLFKNAIPEKEMYTPMVSVCVHYCHGSSAENMGGHAAPTHFHLQRPAWSRWRSFVQQQVNHRTSSASEG
jgi:hypothetical protein